MKSLTLYPPNPQARLSIASVESQDFLSNASRDPFLQFSKLKFLSAKIFLTLQCFCFCFRPDSSDTFTSRYGEPSMKKDEVTRLVDGTVDDDFVNPVKKCTICEFKYLNIVGN